MILETVSASLLTGVVAAVGLSFVRNEPLPSLQVDEHGKRNPMLPYWIVLSIVHVGIVYAWAYCMGDVFHLIRLRDEVFDVWWVYPAFFVYYWVSFEALYWCFHRAQHAPCRAFGDLTGHKGDLSEKFHHGMKPPYGPDYLTAFSSHPFDAFVVQFSAQSPWFWLAIASDVGGLDLRVSCTTYGLVLSWMVYIGMRAHDRKSFGGAYHCKHHDDPSAGPYSFSGIPERLVACMACK